MGDSATPARQRFDAAVHFIANYQPTGGSAPVAFDDSVKLSFYGLYKSATEGPCRKPRPGLFDLVGRAKIDAWASNGEKSREQAMLDYVSLLDRLHPQWRSWEGIPEALRAAVRPATFDAQTPRASGSADRSGLSTATSGIYGDFTTVSSAGRVAEGGGAGGRIDESPSTGAGPAPAWALGSPLPAHLETPAGAVRPAPPSVGPALSASAIEGSGGRTSLARSSSSSAGGGGEPAAGPGVMASPPASAAHAGIRWSLSPNLPLPAPSVAASPASPHPLAAEKLAEMCGSLEQRVESQRAALADAHAALAAAEGELAALQAAYAGAAGVEAGYAGLPQRAVAVVPAQPRRRGGLLGVVGQMLWGWAARLLRRGARYPLATAVLALFLVLLALRLRRGGGKGARQLLTT